MKENSQKVCLPFLAVLVHLCMYRYIPECARIWYSQSNPHLPLRSNIQEWGPAPLSHPAAFSTACKACLDSPGYRMHYWCVLLWILFRQEVSTSATVLLFIFKLFSTSQMINYESGALEKKVWKPARLALTLLPVAFCVFFLVTFRKNTIHIHACSRAQDINEIRSAWRRLTCKAFDLE